MTSTDLAVANSGAVASSGGGALSLSPNQTNWTPEQLAVVRQLGLEGASEGELSLFLHVCQQTGLDPFAKQIYGIMRNQYNQNTRHSEPKLTIQTGIDGFRLVASRADRRTGEPSTYEGRVGPLWCGRDGIWTDVWTEDTHPYAAKVGVYKRGFREPLWATCHYSEYVQTKSDGSPVPMWANMPANQLAKCLPGKALIQTDRGSLTIRAIVQGRLPVKVRSIDLSTGEESWQPVVSYWRNEPTNKWVRLRTINGLRGNRPLRLTADHPVLTPMGWQPAGDLLPGDEVAVASPTLSQEQEQVILGGLLGDGSMARQGMLSGYATSHSVRQESYLLWQAEALSNLRPTVRRSMQTDGAGGSHPTIRMHTAAVPALLAYRSMKPEEMLDRITDLGLAVWLMDDGAVKRTGGASGSVGLSIHCCGFSAEFADATVTWLRDRYDVSAKVLRRDRNPYVVIGHRDAVKLLARLRSYLSHSGTVKEWVAGPIPKGLTAGMVYSPVLSVEHIVKKEAEARYDIEVAGTHTFVANNIVLHNCAEAAALRGAFPQDLSSVYAPEEMGHVAAQSLANRTVEAAPMRSDEEQEQWDAMAAAEKALDAGALAKLYSAAAKVKNDALVAAISAAGFRVKRALAKKAEHEAAVQESPAADEVVDAEVVPSPSEEAAVDVVEQVEPEPAQPVAGSADALINKSAATILSRHFATIGINTPEGRIKGVKDSLGIDIAGLAELTVEQANRLTQAISKIALSRKRATEEPEDVPLPEEPS